MVVAKEPSRRNPPVPGSGADPTKPQLRKAFLRALAFPNCGLVGSAPEPGT